MKYRNLYTGSRESSYINPQNDEISTEILNNHVMWDTAMVRFMYVNIDATSEPETVTHTVQNGLSNAEFFGFVITNALRNELANAGTQIDTQALPSEHNGRITVEYTGYYTENTKVQGLKIRIFTEGIVLPIATYSFGSTTGFQFVIKQRSRMTYGHHNAWFGFGFTTVSSTYGYESYSIQIYRDCENDSSNILVNIQPGTTSTQYYDDYLRMYPYTYIMLCWEDPLKYGTQEAIVTHARPNACPAFTRVEDSLHNVTYYVSNWYFDIVDEDDVLIAGLSDRDAAEISKIDDSINA